MFKKSLFVLLSYFPISTFATEFEFSVGAGFQYSGVIGTQLAIKHQESKYFVTVGLPGYSVGMQTMISADEHHSAGLSVGKLQRILGGKANYGFITYNYHVNGFNNDGWLFGAGVGMYDEKAYKEFFSHGDIINPSKKAMITLDVGYKF